MKAIRMYGYYRPEQAMDSLDDLTRETVRRLGFQTLCLSENQEADRANFRRIYEELASRNRVQSMIPAAVKEVISKIRQDMAGTEVERLEDRKAGS